MLIGERKNDTRAELLDQATNPADCYGVACLYFRDLEGPEKRSDDILGAKRAMDKAERIYESLSQGQGADLEVLMDYREKLAAGYKALLELLRQTPDLVEGDQLMTAIERKVTLYNSMTNKVEDFRARVKRSLRQKKGLEIRLAVAP